MTNLRTILQKINAIFLVIVMVLSLVLGSVSQVYAGTESEIHIKDFHELITFAFQSWDEKYNGFAGKTIYLDADINLNSMDQQLIDALKKKHLTIGKKDCPFRGTFDGQNHRISNLRYNEKFLVDANGGLFFGVEGGTVKNLIIDNADINSTFQGGLIAGYGKNALFQNITILNSDFRIDTVNNVLSLITNAGFTGGAIVGSIENSTLYNCEISGTYVHNNVTNGISALCGEGMYMGGLVGWASNSTIEYCRARSNYVNEANGREIRQSHIKNKYDIAVGALGGKSLYAGGIVGGVNNGTNIIDCFSTAEIEFYAANYVAVGSGIAGYAGGITGALRGNGSTIERCHYAGDIHSYQYNAIAVIPIIQHNAHIAGINYLWKDNSKVENSYFRPSDIKSGVSISAVHKDGNTELYGSIDETYQHINFWESKGFDFKGTTERSNIGGLTRPKPEFDGNSHINKWVMDYNLGIPVHGNAVGATFDFPGAGKVQIGKTGLVETPVETDDPYSFAIQGINPTEAQKMTFEQILNPGYRFKGWYQKDNILSTKRSVQDIKELLNITADSNNRLGDASQNPVTMNIKDNRLFVAAVEGQVTYHNADGTEIGTDWHRCETPLKGKIPLDSPRGAKFYGWTTIPRVENGIKAGYPSITSTELNDIKQKNELYHDGDPVLKEMQLYPIYVDSKANVITMFEGHEQDNLDDITKRVSVGKTEVGTDENGVFINVTGEDTNGAFPNGYKFKGWYKQIPDGSLTNEVCVSRNQKYYVPDLTEKVTYVARFEYAVEYYTRAFCQNNGKEFTKLQWYATVWHNYTEGFEDIPGPAFGEETICGWGLNEPENHGKNFNGVCSLKLTDANKKITEPLNVYSHNRYDGNSINDNYASIADTDFPNSGKTSSTAVQSISFQFSYEPFEGYHYNFWTLERNGSDGKWTYKGNPFTTTMNSAAKNYYGRAMVYADVNFHNKDGALALIGTRRYESRILLKNEDSFTYVYPHVHGVPIDPKPYDYKNDQDLIDPVFKNNPSPSDTSMAVDGYAFLGWVSTADITKGSYEWRYIFDVEGDNSCTSDVEKVQPYLVTDEAKVYETQDLYPVYAKYDVEVTNNILELGNLSANANKPAIPTYVITSDPVSKGKATITISAEHNKTNVLSDEPGEKYKLDSIICEYDGVKKKLELTSSGSNEYIAKDFPIIADKHYKFIANYSPLLVVYHMDDQGTTKTVVRNAGEHLGVLLEPDYTKIADVADSCFIGWTKVKPNGNNAHKYNSRKDFTESGMFTKDSIVSKNYVVKQNMGLYPVFIKPSVKVNSNIDTLIEQSGKKPTDYRSLVHKGTSMELTAKEYPGYIFTGWYTEYDSMQNTGNKVNKHLLNSEDLYKEQTYTAVYAKSLTVTYHDLDGNAIHTVNVESGTRIFVDKVKDESGNIIPDKEYIIDGDANLAITSKLTTGQEFHEWQWKKDNTMIAWKDFKDVKITQNMDIYPSIIEMSAKDSEAKPYAAIDFNIIEEKKVDPSAKEGEHSLAGLFTEAYNQPNLTLSLKISEWDPNSNKKKTIPLKNIPTRMYLKNSSETVVEASDGPINTDSNGDALHEFFGKIIVTKKYSNVSKDIKGQTVYVELIDSNNEKRVIPIEITEDKDSKTLEGKAIVNLPVGTYIVKEDDKWSWRDSSSGLEKYSNVVINIGDEKNIVITNTRNNNKWFDGITRKKNIFNIMQ